jgi:hypothetical protein
MMTAVDVTRGSENDIVQFVFLAVTQAELAIDVFNHNDGAVNDDAEIDGTDGEEVSGFAGGVKKDEGEKQRQGYGECGNHGGAQADEEKNENQKDEDHAANEVPFHGVGGHADKIATVVEGTNLDVGRKNVAIEVLGLFLNALQYVLRLFTAAHQDDAFHGVIVFLRLGLKPENAKARRVADFHVTDILNANGNAIVAADDDLADVFGVFEEAEAANVVKLAALGVETAARVGVVGGEGTEHLHNGEVIVVEPRRVQQDVILHGGPAEAGIVRDARDAAVGANNNPIIESLQFLRRTIRAFQDVPIDEAAWTEKRRHARHDTGGKSSVSDALEDDLAGEIGIDTFVEGEAEVRKSVKRDGAHHRQVGRAVHGQFEGQGGEAFDFFRGMAGPLGDELDHGRRKIGIGINGHALKRNGARDDDEHGNHHHQEALLESKLDNAMNHLEFSRRVSR